MGLIERDKRHIWHPLTQHKISAAPKGIVKAKDALLWDENGKEYIDGIASWYTAMYGHCNEHIIAAVGQQMRQLDQVMFTGFTHEPAVQLSEKLMGILPANQQKIFFNDNGSTAVEAAIKMALQYYFNRGEKRTTLIAFENGFHGDTFGAMSVSGLSVYNGPFEDFFIDVQRISVPMGTNNLTVLSELKTMIAENDCAAFIYEPLVQGAAGMKIHNAEGINALLKYCKEQKVITIADEVMTGFGKTGKHFASLYMDAAPDIICLGKSLTAGMITMSITSCTQEIYNAFLDDSIAKAFFHAHTYSANPLACAAANASLDLLAEGHWQAQVSGIEAQLREELEACRDLPAVADVRVLGAIGVVELHEPVDMQIAQPAFVEEGIWIRPFGELVYTMPPYVIEQEDLSRLTQGMHSVVSRLPVPV